MSFNRIYSPNAVKTALDMVSVAEFNRAPNPSQASALDPLLFNQDRATSSAVVTEVFGSTGTWLATAEEAEITAHSPRVKDNQVFAVVDYKERIPVTREFMRDEKWGLVARAVREAANMGMVTREKAAMDVFRLGFTTNLTNDGVSIFNNNHITVSGDTVDNLLTDALDDDSLNAALVAMGEQKNQAGVVVGRRARTLLVPMALYKQAVILADAKAEERPGTANREINVYSAKYDLVIKSSPYLGAANGGSDTAWFLLADNHNVYRWEREGFNTDYLGPEYSDTDTGKYIMRFAEAFGATQYDGLFASTGLT